MKSFILARKGIREKWSPKTPIICFFHLFIVNCYLFCSSLFQPFETWYPRSKRRSHFGCLLLVPFSSTSYNLYFFTLFLESCSFIFERQNIEFFVNFCMYSGDIKLIFVPQLQVLLYTLLVLLYHLIPHHALHTVLSSSSTTYYLILLPCH